MFYTSTAQLGIGTPYDPAIASASAATGIPVALLKAVIAHESSWNPNAINLADPSYGLMQINTGPRGHPDVAPAQALDPNFAIPYGAQILADQLARRGGDVALALAGYNAGTSRTDADLQTRIAANTNGVGSYVADILAYQAWYQASDPASGGAADPNVLADPTYQPPPISGGSGLLDTLFGPTGVLTAGPTGPGTGPGTDDPYPGLDLGSAAGLPVTMILIGLVAWWWVGRG